MPNLKQNAKSAPSPGTGEKRYAKSQSARDLILSTAERLYAEFGISAVSLRDIAAAAGQKNNAAVQYHFGGKDNLVKEIVNFRISSVKEKAKEIIPQLLDDKEHPQVEDYVSAFVLPFASSINEENYYPSFLSRYIMEDVCISRLLEATTASGLDELKIGVSKVLSNYPKSVIDERWEIFGVSLIHSLAIYQNARRAGVLVTPLDKFLKDFIRYHTAGLKAPVDSAKVPGDAADAREAPSNQARRGEDICAVNLQSLQNENARLKILLADVMLDNATLKEAAARN